MRNVENFEPLWSKSSQQDDLPPRNIALQVMQSPSRRNHQVISPRSLPQLKVSDRLIPVELQTVFQFPRSQRHHRQGLR